MAHIEHNGPLSAIESGPAGTHHSCLPPPEMMKRPFAIFLPSFGQGGVERMMVNLAGGISERGYRVDLVINRASGPYLGNPDRNFQVVELGLLGQDLDAAASRYFTGTRPMAVLTSKEENDLAAIRARKRSRVDARIIVRVPVNVSSRMDHKGTGWIRKRLKIARMRRILGEADSIIAVSEGVASDITAITGISREEIRVIHNPVVTPELKRLAGAPADHEWLTPKDRPVIMSIGRLGSQKDFETLIAAFREVRTRRACRLLILGEGRRHARLEGLAGKLGLSECVQLPGFVPNPYAYLARADLFVLSSMWEGSPNALTEALALGIPVVSTDCESGPREILQNGRFGSLVPVGDVGGLASAILRTLDDPLPSRILMEAVTDYTLDAASLSYIDAIFPGSAGQDPGVAD